MTEKATFTQPVPETPVYKLPKNSKIDWEAESLAKLPEPMGRRILILPYKGKKTTKGGLHLPDEHVDREALATVCGLVLKVGPLAYKDSSKFDYTWGHSRAWCKQGDWVIFGRYAGARFRIDGGEVRLLNDDEILATIDNPEDIINT